MTPQTQRFKHDPEGAGTWGDCWPTCMACILDLPRPEIPHFYDNGVPGSQGRAKARRWLEERGLALISHVYLGSEDLGNVLRAEANNNPGMYYILSGESRNGTCHSVVGLNAKIIWDPSQDKSGIVGPCPPWDEHDPDCGFWYVEYIGSGVSLVVDE